MNWRDIDAKWQARWEEGRDFEAEPDKREKKFITVAYPYPNSPQHLGHGRTYTIADVHARYCRMRGYNVLFPMGFHYTGTPILGMARRIKDGDPEVLSGLRDIFGVPDDAIATFVDPMKIADYFRAEIRRGMIEIGYSIDWRREFTTVDPAYRRFVEWQVLRLRDRGLIGRGSHPVGWCPADGNPVSQHDTMGDVEPSFTEYDVMLFKSGGRRIPVATLRPETVHGATNIWANPDVEYEVAAVDGEEWIISKECAAKLVHLGRDVEPRGTVRGSELVGASAEPPHGGPPVPVLPARFADPGTGTGLVMSVPAHAPYDWQALADLGGDDLPEPVTIIETEGLGDCPAREACERLGIKDQDDRRLEEATSEIYGKEFYGGRMTGACGDLAGMRVAEARDAAREGLAVPWRLLELDAEVKCRCGERCVVRVLDDQWFLNYGDDAWKRDAASCLGAMEVLPPAIKQEFPRVLEWLRERACARQRGLGTPLPWDGDWIVESLSDSVIYMAFYVVARFVGAGEVSPDELTPGALDHVFLGIGDPPSPAISRMRDEFLYYYPVDSRHSGRDLVPNHLTFFVMNHAALFPREHWPRQIVVNGSVLMDGKKMSKSMGNIVPLRAAVAEHGADPVRLATLLSAELLQDADMDMGAVPGISKRLEALLGSCGPGGAGPGAPAAEDRWMLERLRRTVLAATSSMEGMRLREALRAVLFDIESDLQWWRRRSRSKGREPDPSIERRVLEARVLMLSPFAPHAADEMWERLGGGGTAARSPWPEPGGAADGAAASSEGLVSGTMEDIARILRTTGMSPSRITIYAAGARARAAYQAILGAAAGGGADMKSVMRGLLAGAETAWVKKDPGFVQKCLKEVLSETAEARADRLAAGPLDEAAILRDELAPLARAEFGAEIEVLEAGAPGIRDPRGKAAHARPFKPAILVE
ncbi:MAG: leucine--tRNA ligase [Nitrosopumilus sp.]|nr:leucine--tRNA ligase [Nitrosopumilus sp.]